MSPALERRIPLIGALRTYDRTAFTRDLTAGLTTAIMLIPQGMAYALLAGLDPIVGLYASTVPLVLYALFGTSRQLAVGPVAMISLLVAAAVAPLAGGDPATYAALAATLALMVGALQLGMGLARLGFLVKFLSHPVISGFTSAAALIIGLSQLKHVLGIDIPRSHHVHEILLEAARHLGEVNVPTLVVATVSIVTLLALERLAPRFPRFLFVVVAATAAVSVFGLDTAGVRVVGDVPAGLPSPALPPVDVGTLRSLFPAAITISLVAFMESISVAKAFARKGGYAIDADQELIGLGAANLGAAVFRGYPVTGGFSRTAVNGQAGAVSGVAGIVTAAVIALTLLFLTPLFHDLPKAVLAAIIMTAVFGLIDVAEVRHLWAVSRRDLGLLVLTFVATLTLGIETGILLGVAASLLVFVWGTSRPHVAVLGRVPGTDVWRDVERRENAEQEPGVLAVRLEAPLFFANTAFLKATLAELEAARGEPIHAIVLDAKAISSIDAAGDALLHELLDDWRARGIDVWVTNLEGPVHDLLTRSGWIDKLGRDRVAERVCHAVDAIAKAREVRLVGT